MASHQPPQAQPEHYLERIHRGAYGGPGRSRFLRWRYWTWRGLATYYVLFFLHLESRRVTLGGSPLSRNLNAFAERWVRSVRQECLSKLILFGEDALQRALNEFIEHFQLERNHQGKGNVLLFPTAMTTTSGRHIGCSERLGGLLRYYSHLRRIFALHHKSFESGHPPRHHTARCC